MSRVRRGYLGLCASGLTALVAFGCSPDDGGGGLGSGGLGTTSGGASATQGGGSALTGGAPSGTGGTVTGSGGSANTGGASTNTGGTSNGNGGTASANGGAALGGSANNTGGSSSSGASSTGGSSSSGASSTSGGASSGNGGAGKGGSGTGGTKSTTGGASTGGGGAGKSGTGGASGGSASGGASTGGSAAGGTGGSDPGGTVTWSASDYVSRKWARWPIPNPPSMNLPHPMSYTDGTDVTDTVTGLVWQKTTNAATTTWQAALDYCTSLGAGWSLPTRIELTSILDNAQSGAKNATLFKYGKSAGWTWASTPWVVNSRKTVDPPLSWFINFSQGDSNNSLSQLAASAYSRCVKIPTTLTLPAAHYTVSNGEVKDNYTGLTWQQAHSGGTVSLSAEQASSYCTSLGLNGQTWRLPSLNELASVVDDVPTGNVSPAVDHTIFPMTATDALYWTASPYGTSTTEKWTLNFLDGFTSHKVTSTLGIARCVRGA